MNKVIILIIFIISPLVSYLQNLDKETVSSKGQLDNVLNDFVNKNLNLTSETKIKAIFTLKIDKNGDIQNAKINWSLNLNKADYSKICSFIKEKVSIPFLYKTYQSDFPYQNEIECRYAFSGEIRQKELILAVVKQNKLYGIIDTTGQYYINCIYDYIGEISEGFVQAVLKKEEGFIHLRTRTFIPFEKWNTGTQIAGYEHKAIFDYTYLYAFQNSNDTIYKPFGDINDSLNNTSLFYDTLYKPNYTFINGVAPIWIGPKSNGRNEYDNGKWGYINKEGQWIIEPSCDVGRLASENQVLVLQNNQIAYFNNEDGKLLSLKYNAGDTFNEGLACVGIGDNLVESLDNIMWVDNGKWGYIDNNYQEIIPLNFDLAFSFSNSYARIQKKGKYGFINKKGETVIPCNFQQATDFKNERAGVVKDSLWGIINKEGAWIVKPKFNDFLSFSYGLASIELNRQKGYINTYGKIVIPVQFEHASPFVNAYSPNCIDCMNRIPFYDLTPKIPFVSPDK